MFSINVFIKEKHICIQSVITLVILSIINIEKNNKKYRKNDF